MLGIEHDVELAFVVRFRNDGTRDDEAGGRATRVPLVCERAAFVSAACHRSPIRAQPRAIEPGQALVGNLNRIVCVIGEGDRSGLNDDFEQSESDAGGEVGRTDAPDVPPPGTVRGAVPVDRFGSARAQPADAVEPQLRENAVVDPPQGILDFPAGNFGIDLIDRSRTIERPVRREHPALGGLA